jgi:1,2-dihydroxy-3-keto-5-methylthiopentene dioxygenase
MVCITVSDSNRHISDPQEVAEFLSAYGIWYEKWNVERRLGDDASSEEILAAFEPEISRLKERGGYQTADVIAVSPETPGLDQMCAKFAKEHTHSEDEVRFTIQGRGLFHINPSDGPVFGITVESGDLINVPAGTRHWFNLCEDKTIRCIRLFLDPAGWSPLYVDDPVHAAHPPVCWGPAYLAPSHNPKSVVEL